MKEVKQRIRRVWPNRKINPVLLLLLDIARPHASLCTREGIEIMGWTLLPHVPYSTDLELPITTLFYS
jgi:hypothetical protein